MTIVYNNKNISSYTTSFYEDAWKIKDVLDVLNFAHSQNKTILGGDILTEKMQHNYDSWYYNIDKNRDLQYNTNRSLEIAKKYITDYINKNGDKYYVIIVLI